MVKKLNLAIIPALLILSTLFSTVHALTPRDISILDDRFTTERYPGGQKICGDHMCKPGEWSMMKHAIQTHLRASINCEDLKKWKPCMTTISKP